MYVYVIKCEPTPATEGSKIPDETPTPEYTPPSGDPPVRLLGGLKEGVLEEGMQTNVSQVAKADALKGEKETLG